MKVSYPLQAFAPAKSQLFKNFKARMAHIDPFFMGAIAIALIFSFHGFHWGWAESWNPDQMLYHDVLFQAWPLEPEDFLKPPFQTYFYLVLARIPFGILGVLFNILGIDTNLRMAELLWARTLNIGLLAGSVFLIFQITFRFFGPIAARIITLIFASSAGFIVEAHYLTADIPLVFWMLAAFYVIQSVALTGRRQAYLLSGFLVGIAAATKYNGVAIAIALIMAHFLFLKPTHFRAWKTAIFHRYLLYGLGMILVGFIVGNPYAVITFPKFAADFTYNYITTPIYDGNAFTDRSYLKFFQLFNEIIGPPVFGISIIAVTYTIFLLLSRNCREAETKGILMLLVVFGLYYYKFAEFPRLETRFVLPIVPFWLMLSAPFWQRVMSRRKVQRRMAIALLSGLLVHNAACSWKVGQRFIEDSRMVAIAWFQEHVPANSTVESSHFVPKWSEMPEIHVDDTQMPFIKGRTRLFQELFDNDPWVMKKTEEFEGNLAYEKYSEAWYSLEQLRQRSPDYVVISSLYYDRFLQNPKIAQHYPVPQQFFQALLAEPEPYQIVFEKSPKRQPDWIYPRNILFVDNHLVVLQKRD